MKISGYNINQTNQKTRANFGMLIIPISGSGMIKSTEIISGINYYTPSITKGPRDGEAGKLLRQIITMVNNICPNTKTVKTTVKKSGRNKGKSFDIITGKKIPLVQYTKKTNRNKPPCIVIHTKTGTQREIDLERALKVSGVDVRVATGKDEKDLRYSHFQDYIIDKYKKLKEVFPD